MDVDAVNLVYKAEVPTEPTAPNVVRNTALAAGIGLVAVLATLVLAFVWEQTVRADAKRNAAADHPAG